MPMERTFGLERADDVLESHNPNVLLVLKIHLLVEEELHSIVDSSVRHPQYLAEAGLRFRQLMSIAKAIHWSEENAPLWEAIKALNRIRNKIAHKLEPGDIATYIRNFALTYPVPNDITLDHADFASAMNSGFGFVYGFLQSIQVKGSR